MNEATEELKRIYCGNVAIEYSHVKDREMRRYLKEWMEQPVTPPSKEERMRILDRLAWSDMFENFLATKYGGAKRFGLEGCESLIPGFKGFFSFLILFFPPPPPPSLSLFFFIFFKN